MSANFSAKIKAALAEDGFLLRIEGWGTMRESPVFHAAALSCLRQQGGTLLIDLSECQYLDSTFLGCLVDLHKRFGRSASSCLLVVADQAQRQRLLAPLQLHRVLPLVDSAPEPLGEWVTLCCETLEQRELAQHVLQCHRRLVEMGGDSGAVFGPIVERLARELNQQQHGMDPQTSADGCPRPNEESVVS
jgi:anti-anti-sigma regulatory factor